LTCNINPCNTLRLSHYFTDEETGAQVKPSNPKLVSGEDEIQTHADLTTMLQSPHINLQATIPASGLLEELGLRYCSLSTSYIETLME
jgi:hypothetical protein